MKTRWMLAPGLLAIVAFAAAPELAGCDACGGVVCPSCPPALEVRITDGNSGQPVDDVVVAGADGFCQVEASLGWTSCEVTLGIGAHDITLSAPGYEDLELSVLVNADSGDDCCSCGYNEKRRDEVMTPL